MSYVQGASSTVHPVKLYITALRLYGHYRISRSSCASYTHKCRRCACCGQRHCYGILVLKTVKEMGCSVKIAICMRLFGGAHSYTEAHSISLSLSPVLPKPRQSVVFIPALGQMALYAHIYTKNLSVVRLYCISLDQYAILIPYTVLDSRNECIPPAPPRPLSLGSIWLGRCGATRVRALPLKTPCGEW